MMSKCRLIVKGKNSSEGCNRVELDRNERKSSYFFCLTDNGGTNTPTALDLTRTDVFNPANGARQNSRKVAVLLTDGESYDYNLTVAAAKLLRVSLLSSCNC